MMAIEINRDDALIVVDVQNDFCPGGALAVTDGDRIVPGINALLPRFDTRVFTRDWHPADHCSFSDNPRFVDKSWPPHCVAETSGARFQPALEIPNDAIVIDKGTNPAKEAYSGFDETILANTLRARHIARVFVCGLATDYCVRATAIDAIKNGFKTMVIEDLCRGVYAETVKGAIKDMKHAGVQTIRSGEIA
ncbi:MAG: nicotinamidase [Candidatus Hydrogenedentes bacterium]|nr:nicotinamidase [Candidatus Hydrogenedentota bacterium]